MILSEKNVLRDDQLSAGGGGGGGGRYSVLLSLSSEKFRIHVRVVQKLRIAKKPNFLPSTPLS